MYHLIENTERIVRFITEISAPNIPYTAASPVCAEILYKDLCWLENR